MVHDERLKSIHLFNKNSNSSYLVNDRIGIYVKYSTKRLTPWTFTFSPTHVAELLDLGNKTDKTYLVFICKNDGIACLDLEEAKVVIDTSLDRNQGVSASRRPREKYKISGRLGEIKYKFGDNQFPSRIFQC
jgi:hypothetical protein